MRYTLFILLLIALISACSSDNKVESHLHITCGAEHISGKQFVNGAYAFPNAKCRSSAYSRTGRYGFKLDEKNEFGPSYKFDSIKKGDIIYASIYRRKGGISGQLVIASKDQIQYESNDISLQENVDWELVKTSFVAKQDYDYVEVYIWNPKKTTLYFDDLTIDCFRDNKKPEDVAEEDILRIEIPESALDSIVAFRNIALNREVITADLKSYFKAAVVVNGSKVPVSLRIKGDWVDHLQGDKWSFRIKFKGSNAYQGMKKFSIQDPHTRSFMMEWFGHRLFEKEDVLTTRYQFKVVYINGVNRGVYALEEHFDKRLLEYRNRREGPIVKFDESGVWQGYYNQKVERKGLKKYPYVASAEILPFSSKRTRRSPVLLGQFILAKSHMARFRDLDKNLDEYFDVDKMARFIAMCDVLNSKHGLIWHNQRNYLNPVNGLLEPIAYDCFPGKLANHRELLGKAAHWRLENDFTSFDALFLNPEFNSLYISYLNKYSAVDYMRDALKEMEVEISYYEALLRHEYPMYKLDRDYFDVNRVNIEEKVKVYEKRPLAVREINKMGLYSATKQNVIFDEVALKVYTVDADTISCRLQFENYLLSGIELVGYSTKLNKNLILPFDIPIAMGRFLNKAVVKAYNFKFRPKNIYYKTQITGDSLIKAKVSPFPPVSFVSILGKDSDVLNIKPDQDGLITLKAGSKHSFSENVYVPRHKTLSIEAGVIIELSNGARFVSYSPVKMLGTKKNPIAIKATGTLGGGVVLLPQSGTVELRHVTFSNLTAANTENWTLTGGVTIYEGSVVLSNCNFLQARSEDALNMVRCDFAMDSCLVSDTYSDGFDADFCTGTLSNSVFTQTGNDCIDFSGSDVLIKSCGISGSGDKGISGGEHSDLSVINCDINAAAIAVASKDQSKVTIENTRITSCTYAFASYRKKAEYGPAELNVKSATLKQVKKTMLIEKDSKIHFEGKQHVGKLKFDIDSMYQEFTKVGF